MCCPIKAGIATIGYQAGHEPHRIILNQRVDLAIRCSGQAFHQGCLADNCTGISALFQPQPASLTVGQTLHFHDYGIAGTNSALFGKGAMACPVVEPQLSLCCRHPSANQRQQAQNPVQDTHHNQTKPPNPSL